MKTVATVPCLRFFIFMNIAFYMWYEITPVVTLFVAELKCKTSEYITYCSNDNFDPNKVWLLSVVARPQHKTKILTTLLAYYLLTIKIC